MTAFRVILQQVSGGLACRMRLVVTLLLIAFFTLLAGGRLSYAEPRFSAASAFPSDDLLEHYRERCRIEIRALAVALDQLNAKLMAELDEIPSGDLLARVDCAWKRGPEARRLYLTLIDVTRKYSAWAAARKLPRGFDTPRRLLDETLSSRWEPLRPMLLPVAHRETLLGWDKPEADGAGFRSHSFRAFEWLMLLNWLGAPPDDVPQFDGAWLRREAGETLVAQWERRTGEPQRFLHGEYEYFPLQAPSLTRDVPSRTLAVLGQVCWELASLQVTDSTSSGAVQTSPHPPARVHDLSAFTRQKERVLTELLMLIARHKAKEPLAVAWFCKGARAFPFLTNLLPEERGDGVAVLRSRAASWSPSRLLQDLRGHCDDQVYDRLTTSLFWYQLSVLHPDGSWTAPTAGWTTRTPRLRPAIAALGSDKDTDASRSRHVDDASQKAIDRPLDVSRAWREICLWVCDCLERARPAEPVAVDVDYRCMGWRLAFGAQELVEVLRERQIFSEIAEKGSLAEPRTVCHVQVTEIEPHRSVAISLRVGDDEIATQQFLISGGWPGWFAVPPSAWLGIVTPGLLLTGTLVLFGRRTIRVLRHPRDAADLWGIGLAWAAIAGAWLLTPAPLPCLVGQRGGVVEIILPVDGVVTPMERLAAAEGCIEVLRELATRVGQSQNPYDPDRSWLPRYLSALDSVRRPRWLPARDGESDAGLETLFELDYRIIGYAWKRQETISEGRLELNRLPLLQQELSRVCYMGEKDLPNALRVGPRPPTSVAIVFGDGDPGTLGPPDVQPAAGLVPVVSMCALTPTRDMQTGRAHDAKSRIRWMTDRSTATFCLRPDGQLEQAAATIQDTSICQQVDAPGLEAQDMDAVRRNWWQQRDSQVERANAVARKFAGEAVACFWKSRAPTSSTVLALKWQPWRLVGLMVTTVVFSGAPLWLCRRGMICRRDVVIAVVGYVMMGLALIVFLPLFAVWDISIAPYGVPTEDGLRCAAWWCLAGITAALGLKLLFYRMGQRSEYARHVGRPDSAWNNGSDQGGWMSRYGWCSLLPLAIGTCWLLSGPVCSPETLGGWLPSNYNESVLVGPCLWCFAGYLLWSIPEYVSQ